MKYVNPPDNLPLIDDEDVHFREGESRDTLKPSQSDAAHDAPGEDRTRSSPANALSQPNDQAMAKTKKTPLLAPLLDAQALCALLLVSRDTVYRLVERGELPCLKIGGQLRFRRDDVEDYVNRCRDAASRRDRYGSQED
jgi:excisionase family DNA binding protein